MTRAQAIKYALRMGFTAEERKAIRVAWQSPPHARAEAEARGTMLLVDANERMKALFPVSRLER